MDGLYERGRHDLGRRNRKHGVLRMLAAQRCLPPPASGPVSPFSLVQQNYASGTTVALSGVSTSNALILVITSFSGGDTVSAVSGGGGTWAKAIGFSAINAGGNGTGEIWYNLTPTGGTTDVSVTFTTTANSPSVTLAEFAGGVVGLDGTATFNPASGGTSNYTDPVYAPTHANCLVVSVSGFQSLGAQANWTAFSNWSSGSNAYNWAAYLLATGTSSVAPSGNAGGGGVAVAVVAFYP